MKLDIETIKRRLLIKYPLFGSIVAATEFVKDNNCYSNGVPTAGTDGKKVYYHEDALNNITEDEQVFLFAHEVCHIALNHINRSEGKDKEVWNIATDGVINALLKKDGLPLIEGSVDIKKAINYDAEELYEELLKEKKDKNKDENSQSSNQDVGHDTHSAWEKALEDAKNQTQAETKNDFLEEAQKEFESLGEKEVFKQNKTERKRNLEKLQDDLVRESHTASSTKDLRTVKNIGNSSPLIDWRRLLKETVKYDIDWSYRNATIEDGVVTPYLEEIPRPETEILLDTSGSVSETLLKNFLRECKNILKTSKVKVGCFDDECYGFTEIRTEEDIDKMEFVGGGGTDFDVAVNAFTRRVENKIIFTDGESYMPDKAIDVIWIVFGDKKINPKGGKVINITGEQLERLMTNNLFSKAYSGKTR